MLTEYEIRVGEKTHKVVIKRQQENYFLISINGLDLHVNCDGIPSFDKSLSIEVDSTKYDIELGILSQGEEVDVIAAGHHFKASIVDSRGPTRVSPGVVQVRKTEVPTKAVVVYAPMSGRVASVMVRVGQNVHAGEALLMLEAMKMENEIAAPRDGKVQSIHVVDGDGVKKNDPLLTLV